MIVEPLTIGIVGVSILAVLVIIGMPVAYAGGRPVGVGDVNRRHPHPAG